MVMSRGRRNKIIIISISIVIIAILITCVVLYFTTDMFKSNEVLFSKYLGKAAQNLETILVNEKEEAYSNSLKNNKYISTTEITADYTNGIGTTAQNNDNIINNLKLTINGKTDNLGGIDYKDFLLQKDEENVTEIEYLKSNDKYGIRFTDLFNKYISVENQNLKEIASKLNINNNVPDKIEEIDLQGLKIKNDELEKINEKYPQVIANNFDKSKFTKINKTDITVGDHTYETNAYTLNLTKEELNNIYIAILEQMKQDETILAKIDILDKALNPDTVTEEDVNQVLENEQEQQNEEQQNQQQDGSQQNGEQQNQQEQTDEQKDENNESNSIKEQFIKKIDDTITQIKNKNIGADEAKITVYENKGETVKVTIDTKEYRISIDTITNDMNNLYIKLFKEIYEVNENSDEIIIEKKEGNTYINRTKIVGEKTYKTNFTKETTIENGKGETNIKLTYDTETNKIEINLTDKKEIVNAFDYIDELDNNKEVVLNKLTDEEFVELRDILNDKGIEKFKNVTEQIDIDQLFKILNELEILPEQITISNVVSLTMSEVSKFNAEFEIYKGQEVDVEAIDNLLKIVKDNLETVEVLSDTTIKLNIVKDTKNEELANKVSEIVNNDKNRSKKYSVDYEYDENTKIITAVIIQILENN